MKQLILTNNGVRLVRVPKPAIDKNSVLVKLQYSMVSTGTEIAGLRPANDGSGNKTTVESVKQFSGMLARNIDRAVRNPKKAVKWMKRKSRAGIQKIMRNAAIQLKPEEKLSALQWFQDDALEFEKTEKGLLLKADDSDWGYQCHTSKIKPKEDYFIAVDIKGVIEGGAVNLGILNHDGSQWINNKAVQPGMVDERLIFNPEGEEEVTVVISNVQKGQAKLALDRIEVIMVPPDPHGSPLSEMDDMGWNLGYSAAGVVLSVGSNVTDIRPGDYVACGGAGKANHAEYVVVPRNLVSRVPGDVDLKYAATTTIGTIALQGVRRAAPALGEKVCVIGLGLLGQMSVQMLRANGCTVIGMDLDPKRVERAEKQGMEWGCSDPDELRKLARDCTKGFGVDRTLIAAATKSNAVINLAMEVTRRKGTVVIVGDVGLDIERGNFYKKEIDLLMSTSYGPGRYDSSYEDEGRDYPYAYVRWTQNRNMESYLEMVANGRLNIEALIDVVCPIENAPTVYKELANSDTPPLGVLLEYSADESSDNMEAGSITLRGHKKRQDGPANYLLVGAGAFGISMLVPNLEKLQDKFFLTGVVSRDSVRGGNFARENRLEILATDLEEVVDRDDVDVLVIATRHHEHADQVIAGIKSGKHVFVEKPIATSWEQLNRIVEVYDSLEVKPVVMVGFNRRFSPAVQALKSAISDRRTPLVINYRLNGGYIPSEHWIQTEQGGGRNIGEACHMYDVFRCLAGTPVVDVYASSIDPGDLPYLKNDNFSATLTYEDGSVATLVYTALGPKQGLPKERIEIFCDGEAYIIDDYKKLFRASDGRLLWKADAVDKGHFEELKRFGEAVANGTSSPISFDEIIETTAVSLNIEDQLHGRFN